MLGLSFGESGVASFRCWAPHAETVAVEIEHDGVSRTVSLNREDVAFFGADLGVVMDGSRYRLRLVPWHNDCYAKEGAELVRRDPYARETEFSSSWCIAVDRTARAVPRASFIPPAFNELVIYELHVGSFVPADAGVSAFSALRSLLAHVKEAGFNCVQLMPITEFGGLWGYNPRQLLSLHGPWGTVAEVRPTLAPPRPTPTPTHPTPPHPNPPHPTLVTATATVLVPHSVVL
jgi:1,4-alpha-glucan branching enzyme